MNDTESRAALCGHCGRPRTGYGSVGGIALCHTGTLPPQGEPLDCYRLVTVYREPLGSRITRPSSPA